MRLKYWLLQYGCSGSSSRPVAVLAAHLQACTCVTAWKWGRTVLKKSSENPLIWAESELVSAWATHKTRINKFDFFSPLCFYSADMYQSMAAESIYPQILCDCMWHVCLVPVITWGTAMFIGHIVYSMCISGALCHDISACTLCDFACYSTRWRRIQCNWASVVRYVILVLLDSLAWADLAFIPPTASQWVSSSDLMRQHMEILSSSEGEMIVHLPLEMIPF